MSETTSRTYHNVKCVNYHHRDQAEKDLGYPVLDNFTMNAEYDSDKEIVFLHCHWCGYSTEIDVTVRPVQIEQRSGNIVTIGPHAK